MLEYLSNYFEITVYYYNPYISPEAEFHKRFSEQRRLIDEMITKNQVYYVCADYDYSEFLEIAKGLEDVREGGERCFKCYELRLKHSAQYAKKMNYDYFCTTLSISPLKNAQKINEIGFEIGDLNQIDWLPSDFKKNEGYKRSIELSRQYNLYRQNYCGCAFSKREREQGET